jgi:hypothetical protein
MGFSHAANALLAQLTEDMNGDLLEALIYHSKAHATAPTVDYPGVIGRFTEFDDHITALHGLVSEGQVRRDDMRLRLATYRVSWEPSTYDMVTRADGSTWRVLSLRRGQGFPWWIMQVRKVVTPAAMP